MPEKSSERLSINVVPASISCRAAWEDQKNAPELATSVRDAPIYRYSLISIVMSKSEVNFMPLVNYRISDTPEEAVSSKLIN